MCVFWGNILNAELTVQNVLCFISYHSNSYVQPQKNFSTYIYIYIFHRRTTKVHHDAFSRTPIKLFLPQQSCPRAVRLNTDHYTNSGFSSLSQIERATFSRTFDPVQKRQNSQEHVSTRNTLPFLKFSPFPREGSKNNGWALPHMGSIRSERHLGR